MYVTPEEARRHFNAQIIHSENGILKEKLKLLESEHIEDIKLSHQQLNQINKNSAMPESRPMIKKKIWTDKSMFSEINSLNTELSKTLDQVLTLKEKDLKPFWRKQSKVISKKLLLPTKTDYVDSDLNFSNQSLQQTMGASWFSMTKTNHQTKNSLKTSFQSSQFFQTNYMGGEVTEIKEYNNNIWFSSDNEKIDFKTLKFKLFPTKEEKEDILFDISNQQRSIWNACVSILKKDISVKDIKYRIDQEKIELNDYKNKIKEIRKIKDKEEKKIKLQELKNTKPKLLKFNDREFRDKVKKYKYTEIPVGIDPESGKKIVLCDYEFDENNNSFPVINEHFKINHNRIPRGIICKFIYALNSNIANYRNNETDFSINYKSKKSDIETICFEDQSYPTIINNIRNKYCYTKIINGRKKRMYLTLKEIKEFVDIKSIEIIHNKNTGEYTLNLPVSKDFNLPDDKRSESQARNIDGNIIALDPGIRTFITGYSLTDIITFGDKCTEKIFSLLLTHDKLIILDTHTQKEKDNINEYKKKLRYKVQCMIDDMHWKTIKYLTSNYSIIICPRFETKNMMKKLSKENNRKLAALSFFKFQERLKYKCKVNNRKLIVMNESYTSRTCSVCGYLNSKCSKKEFNCKSCNFNIDRDINGSRNIMIKTLMLLEMESKDELSSYISNK